MKKIAIIGAKGFIGRHLEWYLKTKMDITPECYDVQDVDEPHYHKVDLTKKESVATININVDYIFFMTGITGTKVGFNKYEMFVEINELTLLNMLDAISKSESRPKIIFPSSRLVYKGVDKALKEDDEKDTKTIYAANKLACEAYLKAYNYNYNIPFTVFRICVPYGNMINQDYSFGTIGFFIKMAESGKCITLYGDGDNKRTFTHLEDLCSQMIYGSFNPLSNNECYNIGGEIFSLNDVAKEIAIKYGVGVDHIPWPKEDWKIESGNTYFDDAKIKTLFENYSLKHTLKDFI